MHKKSSHFGEKANYARGPLKYFSIFCVIFFLSSLTLRGEKSNELSEYLVSSKSRYEKIIVDNQNSELIHFVLGNESADLDSIVSSIAYAYFLTQQHPSEFYIPLINISREECSLRKDVLYLFQQVGISRDSLLFIDDKVPLKTLWGQKRLRLNLVDHNILKPSQQYLANIVERIIDHHKDENKYYPILLEQDKLISSTGSNATFIAEKFLDNKGFKISPHFATFLLAPVLIDTVNLESVEKTTPRDREVAQKLKFLASDSLPLNFYTQLYDTKNDISGLTPSMLLLKDFKEYSDGNVSYGISSLPSSVYWTLQDMEIIAPVIKKYASDKNLDYLILLFFGPQTNRTIFVYSPFSHLLNDFDLSIKKDPILKDLLIFDSFLENYHLLSYKTEKPLSRKQFQPLLHFPQKSEKKE